MVGILSFPSGLSNEEVMAVCGEKVSRMTCLPICTYLSIYYKADAYSLGTCGIRWAYVLACIAFCDGIILGKEKERIIILHKSFYFRLPSLHPGN